MAPTMPEEALPFANLNINAAAKTIHTFVPKNIFDEDSAQFTMFAETIIATVPELESILDKTKTTPSIALASKQLSRILTLNVSADAQLVLQSVANKNHGIERFQALKVAYGPRDTAEYAPTILNKLQDLQLKTFVNMPMYYTIFCKLLATLNMALSVEAHDILAFSWFINGFRPGRGPPELDPLYYTLQAEPTRIDVAYRKVLQFIQVNGVAWSTTGVEDYGRRNALVLATTAVCAVICRTCGGMAHYANKCPTRLSDVAECCLWCSSFTHTTAACKSKTTGWVVGARRLVKTTGTAGVHAVTSASVDALKEDSAARALEVNAASSGAPGDPPFTSRDDNGRHPYSFY